MNLHVLPVCKYVYTYWVTFNKDRSVIIITIIIIVIIIIIMIMIIFIIITVHYFKMTNGDCLPTIGVTSK